MTWMEKRPDIMAKLDVIEAMLTRLMVHFDVEWTSEAINYSHECAAGAHERCPLYLSNPARVCRCPCHDLPTEEAGDDKDGPDEYEHDDALGHSGHGDDD